MPARCLRSTPLSPSRPDDVVLTAMKKAEDSHALIFHMYEWAGKGGSAQLRVPPGRPARWRRI